MCLYVVMGHQSYILFIKDDKDKAIIHKAIDDHNNATAEMWDNRVVGEELTRVMEVKVSDKIPKAYQKYEGAILCGNGGGGQSTLNWFRMRRVRCVPYQSKCERWFKPKEKETATDEEMEKQHLLILITARETLPQDKIKEFGVNDLQEIFKEILKKYSNETGICYANDFDRLVKTYYNQYTYLSYRG